MFLVEQERKLKFLFLVSLIGSIHSIQGAPQLTHNAKAFSLWVYY